MSNVDERFEQYTAAARAGAQVDPTSLVEGLTQDEQRELTLRLTKFDNLSSEAQSLANTNNPILDRVARSASGLSGIWPALLPRLREEASLDREQLAQRLANELGHPESVEKFETYYHQLEWGSLPATNVDPSVVKALADILDTDADELYESGTAGVNDWTKRIKRSQGGPLPKRAFARLVGESKPMTVNDSEFDPPKAADWDDTDRLFLGG
ncbi:MAG: helix-turn-helix transcriptional regulator [Solirubrobacterales bacterium]|nr:helix-turn-helix transcriptional regulator [Solirubrobacterales bacterium]